MSGSSRSRRGPSKHQAAVIGCGRIASLFNDDPKRAFVATHAGAYRSHPKVELAAAADRDAARLRAFGNRWKVRRLFESAGGLLKEVRPDLLSVCTWTDSHREITLEAIRAGVPVVFCEKPLASTLAQADEMVARARRRGTILAVNHHRRWDPMHRRIRAFLQAGGLGDVEVASAYYAGGIANTGTHLFDLMRFLLGDARWIQAHPVSSVNGPDPLLDGILETKRGARVTFQALRKPTYVLFEIDVYGTKGRLRIVDCGKRATVWMPRPSRTFSEYQELLPAKRPSFSGGLEEALVCAVRDLVVCLEKGRVPQCTGEDGLKAVELACAARASAKHGGSRVNLPLVDRKIPVLGKVD